MFSAIASLPSRLFNFSPSPDDSIIQKFSIEMLLRLPSSIISSLLSEWLEVYDLARLDQAINNRLQRQKFIEYLRYNSIVIQGLENESNCRYFHWALLRNLKLKRVDFTNLGTRTEDIAIMKMIQKPITFVEHVELRFTQLFPMITSASYAMDDNSLEAILNNVKAEYPRVKSMRISECKYLPTGFESLFSALVNALQLRKLNVSHCSGVSNAVVTSILENCSTLTHLDVSYCFKLTNDAFLNVSYMRSLNVSEKVIFSAPVVELLAASSVVAAADAANNTNDSNKIRTHSFVLLLESLNLAGCMSIGDPALVMIAVCSPGLKQLNVNSGQYRRVNITDVTLKKISEYCPCITLLDIGSSQRIHDEGMRALADKCHDLESINVDCCNLVVSNASMLAIAKSNPKMKCLSMRITHHGNSLNMRIPEFYTHLEFLDITKCTGVEDRTIEHIARYCQKLRHIKLGQCIKLTSQAVIFLAEHRKELKTICLEKFFELSSGAVKRVAECCRDLEELNLNYNYKLPAGCLHYVAMYCQKLRKLEAYCCDNLNDDSMLKVSKKCHKLQYLDVGSELLRNSIRFNAVTTSTVLALAQCCRGLRYLNLKGREMITDKAIQELAANCPNLHTIILSGCSKLTDEAIVAIANNCHSLSTLYISSCSLVTDVSIYRLISSDVPLRSLSYICCPRITDKAIIQLVEQCPVLTLLNTHSDWVEHIRSAYQAIVEPLLLAPTTVLIEPNAAVLTVTVIPDNPIL